MKHGIEFHPNFRVKTHWSNFAGTVKEFNVESSDPEDRHIQINIVPRATIRSFSPHVLYAWCALKQAIADSGLTDDDITDPEVGMYTSSGGSMRSIHKHFEKMDARGVMARNPLPLLLQLLEL